MYIDLQGQTTILIVHALALVIGAIGVYRYYTARRRRIGVAELIIAAVLSIVAVAGYMTVRAIYPRDSFPFYMLVWALPLIVTLTVTLRGIRHPRTVVLPGIGAVMSLILFALLVNNHYGVYKTIPPIAQKQSSAATSEVKAVAFESYYQPPHEIPAKGSLSPLTIPSSTGFAVRTGRLYLPPAAQANRSIRLPVVVLLAGYPGGPTDWESLGIASIMDEFAARHKGLAPIVAMVDHGGTRGEDTECVNSKFGAVETYLTKDVPAYLRANVQVDHQPSSWTTAGYSAGGMCSAMLAIRNPDVYKNFMNLTGETRPSYGNSDSETIQILFGGSRAQLDQHDTLQLLQRHNGKYGGMNGYFVIGIDDASQLNASIDRQQVLAEKAGIVTQLLRLNGGHTGSVWTEGYRQGLEWMMARVSFTVAANK